MPTIKDVNMDSPSCQQYIDSMSAGYKGSFARFAQDYKLKKDVVEKLKACVNDHTIVVLFADWCGDARRAVPVLAKLEKELGVKILALGGMTKPPYGSSKFWAVPPSPKEVEVFNITSSPTVIVFNKDGEEIGRIKTRPRMTPTVEEEILKIIQDSQKSKST